MRADPENPGGLRAHLPPADSSMPTVITAGPGNVIAGSSTSGPDAHVGTVGRSHQRKSAVKGEPHRLSTQCAPPDGRRSIPRQPPPSRDPATERNPVADGREEQNKHHHLQVIGDLIQATGCDDLMADVPPIRLSVLLAYLSREGARP